VKFLIWGLTKFLVCVYYGVMSIREQGYPYDIPIKISPHVDLDITITWTGDKPTTIEVVGLGKTKTMTLTWSGDNLTSIATVIT